MAPVPVFAFRMKEHLFIDSPGGADDLNRNFSSGFCQATMTIRDYREVFMA